jgi:site-specific DNA-methyltransferase (adenine-specific)
MDTPDMLANDSKAPLWSVPLMYEVVENTGAIYLCTRFDVAPMWQQALIDAGAILKTPIIWDKGNWTSGDLTGDYANQCELILFAHKGRHKLKDGRPSNLWRVSRDPAGEHPTPKPVALMARCIHNSVNKGGTVLDPFMGSGSTGVAAIREGCHFIGIELELKYFDISCRRIEAEDSQLSIFDFME